MRTSIDLPDSLMRRVKLEANRQRSTFRRVVIDALEQALASSEKSEFKLRDASFHGGKTKEQVSADRVNGMIDQLRDTEHG